MEDGKLDGRRHNVPDEILMASQQLSEIHGRVRVANEESGLHKTRWEGRL